jgi:hypothetical protein
LPSDRRARRFQDILDNIARIERFTAGLDFEAFTRNEETFYVVLHALLIISEAARKLQGDAEVLAPQATSGRRSEIWEMCFGMLMTVLTPTRSGASFATISAV